MTIQMCDYNSRAIFTLNNSYKIKEILMFTKIMYNTMYKGLC